jgi:hypothetical protein
LRLRPRLKRCRALPGGQPREAVPTLVKNKIARS